ncbi:MAG: energy transducer TonB [Acidobacteriia bacterium]|nr:energy transducer TonB [Terriglobia bacterium]
MPLRKFCLILLVAVAPAMAVAAVRGASLRVGGEQASLTAREQQVWRSAVHDSEFAAIPHVSTRSSCAATQPPEALATPNPLLDKPDPASKVTVSFIIGTDGRVHSPLILESNGTSQDRSVLDAVRSWRYRPAMCNGVPTEAEAKIEFSSR